MKICVAQIDCVPGSVADNTARMLTLTREAASKGCRVVLFPELSDTGYDLPAIPRLAAVWPDGPVGRIAEACRDSGIYVIAGLSEREDDLLYNSLAIVGPDGNIVSRYRKSRLFTAGKLSESSVFTPGSELVVHTVDEFTVGLSICFDLRFPEHYLELTGKGATLLVNVAAWPASRISHWDTLLRARAIESQAYVVGVNRAGTDGRLKLGGSSCVVTPSGDLAWVAPPDHEEIGVVEISRNNVESFRQKLPMGRKQA